MNLHQCGEMPVLRGFPRRITHETHDVIGVSCRICERTLPHAFLIDWLLPHAVIAFVDGAAERNSGLFQRSDVLAQIHEQSGIRRQLGDPVCELPIERYAASTIDISFPIADGSDAPDRSITRCSKQ